MDFGTPIYGPHPANDYFTSAGMDEPAGGGEPGTIGGYSSAMDNPAYADSPNPNSGYELGVKDIGMSVPLGISAQNVAGIYSKIRMGTGNIELQFPGYQSGQRQSQTPEMYGEDQRQAIREMAQINEVDFTTHASFSMMGMLGRDQRDNFSMQMAAKNLQELKTAIDFQADVSGGGSVVMHSGEFDRPITDITLDDENGRLNLSRDKDGRLMFRDTHTQEWTTTYQLLDDRTSQKYADVVRKDKMVAISDWKTEKKGRDGVDQEGNRVYIKPGDYIDYQGKKILQKNLYDPVHGRVPEYDTEEQQFKTKLVHFDHFRKEAENYNKWLKKYWHTLDKYKGWTQEDFERNWYYEKRYPEESYLHATLETQEGNARGWAANFSKRSDTNIKALKKLEKAYDYYSKAYAHLPEDKRGEVVITDNSLSNMTGGIVPGEQKPTLDFIKEQIRNLKKDLQFEGVSSSVYEQQAKDTRENIDHIISPIKRLEKHGIRNYAEAGIHAMRRSRDPNNPVVVAIEHIFPEQFGGHPEELKWIIGKSRDRMVEMLTSPKISGGTSWAPTEWTQEAIKKGVPQDNPYYMNVSKKEAEKIAEKHLKATIDTGHINMWRKYWQEDPRKTPEQNDAAFKKWAVNSIESLAKNKMIGNVHLADNYGYHDDHLSPGQGNSPVREIMDVVKKHGYEKAVTVEPGADASTDLGDFHGLMKTWRFFGSGVYGMGMGGGGGGAPGRWGDIQNSYFGQGAPPSYVFGSYAPSNDWTLWSQVPME